MVEPLYRRILRDRFDTLPQAVRDLHTTQNPPVIYSGMCDVELGAQPLAGLAAQLAGFPPRPGQYPITFSGRPDETGEVWTRQFGDARFQTHLNAGPDNDVSTIQERFGALRAVFALSISGGSVTWNTVAVYLFGIPLPRFVRPTFDAREWEDNGAYMFDVDLRAPVLGRMIRYRGRLTPDRNSG